MKKNRFLLLIILLLALFLSGCWDYIEYERIAQVVGIAVDFDKKTRQTTITQQYLIPRGEKGSSGGGSSSGKTGYTYSVTTGRTTADALNKLQQVVVERVFYGYLNIFVLGEDAARNVLLDQIEILDRASTVRETAYCVVCSGKAELLLGTVDENIPAASSLFIVSLINNARGTGATFPVTIHDVSEMLAIGGWEVTIPRIIAASSQPKPKLVGTEGNIRMDEKYQGSFRASGLAAFKGTKFVGWLNEKETLGFSWIAGKKISAYKMAPSSDKLDPSDILNFRVLSSKSKIKTKFENGEPAVTIDIGVTADLRKYYSGKGSEYLSPEEISQIEQLLCTSIRSDVQAALDRGQSQLQTDIFGFGFAFFRKYPSLWKSNLEKTWPEIYPDVPVKVTIKAKVINTGTNIRRLDVK